MGAAVVLEEEGRQYVTLGVGNAWRASRGLRRWVGPPGCRWWHARRMRLGRGLDALLRTMEQGPASTPARARMSGLHRAASAAGIGAEKAGEVHGGRVAQPDRGGAVAPQSSATSTRACSLAVAHRCRARREVRPEGVGASPSRAAPPRSGRTRLHQERCCIEARPRHHQRLLLLA